MKHLLTLLLILFCFNVYGQTKDSTWKWSSSTSGSSGLLLSVTHTGTTTTNLSLDTIPILMLYCDTVRSEWVDSAIVNGKLVQVGEKRINYPALGVHWNYGYEVLSPVYHHFDHITTKQHISYLDKNKQPLRKSIVVWMVKPLN